MRHRSQPGKHFARHAPDRVRDIASTPRPRRAGGRPTVRKVLVTSGLTALVLAGAGPTGAGPTAVTAAAAAAPDIAFPGDAGVINVKSAPYKAKGDGVADDTAALRRAFLDNDYRDGETGPTLSTFSARTVYLPAGTYRITDSLLVTGSSLRIVGAGEGRTTIKLDNGAAGFGSANSPKYVLKTGTKMTTNQANSGFGN